jgi:Fe-S cluster assembly protein SufD
MPAAATRWLLEHGLPTERDEEWRYTPVTRILARHHRPARSLQEPDLDSARELLGPPRGMRVVCIDGRFNNELSGLHDLPTGLRCVGIDPRSRSPRVHGRLDAFRLLNDVVGSGVAILLTADVRLGEPVEIVHVATTPNGPTAVHPRTHIDVRARSRLVVLERYLGLPGTGLTNAGTTITVGPEAEIVHQRLTDEPDSVDHIGHTSMHLSDDAEVHSTSVLVGGRVVRSATDATLGGNGARLVLRGLSLGTAEQCLDQLATVEHAGSRCSSDQLFASVVDGRARSAFGGQVIVRPGTAGTRAHQMSRNLVLARTAEAMTRPWLEILADDVQCTHGATVGRLSDDALLYLRSRGIPEGLARRMLIRAFVDEFFDGIEPAWLRILLESRLDRWLDLELAA